MIVALLLLMPAPGVVLRLPVLPAPMLDLHMAGALFLFVFFNHNVITVLLAATRHHHGIVADHNVLTFLFLSGQHADRQQGND